MEALGGPNERITLADADTLAALIDGLYLRAALADLGLDLVELTDGLQGMGRRLGLGVLGPDELAPGMRPA